MGNFGSRGSSTGSTGEARRRSSASTARVNLPEGTLPSLYQRRLEQLAQEVVDSPPPVPLEETLRQCVDFCYGGGLEWAPHVRVTVYADNAAEHQANVPVYSTLLCTWGVPSFANEKIPCRNIAGTDVSSGYVTRSPFWSRSIRSLDRSRSVLHRELGHQLLHWFVSLDHNDKRKQLLVNIVLQLHEACYNCIGRHKEVFEYCIYDLLEAEMAGNVISSLPGVDDEARAGASAVVQRHAGLFLDRHKRHALQASILSPLKFIFQKRYEVFENIDSHGASFWGSVLMAGCFGGLELPFESIVELDTGWTWAAVDFLPAMMQHSETRAALERFMAPGNIGIDWRTLTEQQPRLRPPSFSSRPARLPGLPMLGGFGSAVAEARRSRSTLHVALRPYADRFAQAMVLPVLLKQCALSAVGSVTWDAALGPALAVLSEDVFGTPLGPADLRAALVDATDAAKIEVDTELFAKLLKAAGVPWVQGAC